MLYEYYPLSQPIVKNANANIVEPLLTLLKTLHLEVQFEGNSRSFTSCFH